MGMEEVRADVFREDLRFEMNRAVAAARSLAELGGSAATKWAWRMSGRW
jgi:hypothetical protein